MEYMIVPVFYWTSYCMNTPMIAPIAESMRVITKYSRGIRLKRRLMIIEESVAYARITVFVKIIWSGCRFIISRKGT